MTVLRKMPQLCLGTAQFGLTYGITNSEGQVPEAIVEKILSEANKSGICMIDTAQAYGNAEIILGQKLAKGQNYKIITKLPAQPQPVFSTQDVEAWDQAFHKSCQRLGVLSLDALLLHAPADLRKPGGQHLEAWLLSLRKKGLVRRIGVSIYTAEDLKELNPAVLDLVQLPLSLYDQRALLNGTLTQLRARGTAIHARSLYLQGLLLTPAAQWPSWVSTKVRLHQQALEDLAKQRGCQLIELALGFAREQLDLEAVVLGVCTVEELAALRNTWSTISPWQKGEWRTWALKDPGILDPRLWPS